MLLRIKAFPRSKQNKIIQNDSIWKIYVVQMSKQGEANKEIVKLLAKHLKIAKNKIKIVYGIKSSIKVIEICDTCMLEL